ncbi:hypothetical protein M404DRAFT_994326 [Pisolithus tinctorius Marx 270]|uniref:Uncharacterized protein n=1 Tax=Pisolithus tinctorius Marx 270 TaxID=870435 RepID=A0A0C3PR97_PISTI|nr:hypothetical protein M404DRAFT_994326 [Pisolithus tinctorius Marx 270]
MDRRKLVGIGNLSPDGHLAATHRYQTEQPACRTRFSLSERKGYGEDITAPYKSLHGQTSPIT